MALQKGVGYNENVSTSKFGVRPGRAIFTCAEFFFAEKSY